MFAIMRWLLGLILLLALAFGAAYVLAGRGAPPRITIAKPDRTIGQAGALDVTAESANGLFSALSITLEQNGKSMPLYALGGGPTATVAQPDPRHLRITRSIGKQSIPDIQQGPARIVVTAT